MGWKAFLTFVLLILIIAYLFSSESGREYLKFVYEKGMELLTEKVSPKNQTFERIPFKLEGKKENFYGISFSLHNVTVFSKGTYKGISLGETEVSLKSGKEANISFQILTGSLNYTDNTIKLVGSCTNLTIDEYVAYSPNGIDFYAEIVPTEFLIIGIKKDVIRFEEITANLTGEKAIFMLKGDRLEINNFEGDFSLQNITVILNGFANKFLINGEKAII